MSASIDGITVRCIAHCVREFARNSGARVQLLANANHVLLSVEPDAGEAAPMDYVGSYTCDAPLRCIAADLTHHLEGN